MIELIVNIPPDKADICGLVFTASGIEYRVEKGENGWDFWVKEDDYDTALETIQEYIEENHWFDDENGQVVPGLQKTYTGIGVAFVLLVFHVLVTQSAGDELIMKYGASAHDIMHGELYRAVTALLLHKNYLHLIGNMAGIALFGTAVCSFTGYGIGWAMILFSGIAGNLLNAVLYNAYHISIGASTAVFGAIGILTGYNCFIKFKSRGQRIKAWLPIGGGLALLGLLGSGQNSDIMAHFLGFFSGIILGGFYAFFIREPVDKRWQQYWALATIGVFFSSWLLA